MSLPDTEFLEIFRDEARARLDHIVETLLALEEGSAGEYAVDALFRDTHTIKGAAGMVGLDDIGALAHVAEDLLDRARRDGVLAIAGDASTPRVVVAEHDGRLAGLAVDEVTDVGELAGAAEETDAEYLSGAVLEDGRLVGIVDVERLFQALARDAA